MVNYYDTSALLSLDEMPMGFALSSVVIGELEHIKTSKTKTEDVRYKARKIAHWLSEHDEDYRIDVLTTESYDILEQFHLSVTNDNLIVASAYRMNQREPVTFYTNDIVLSLVAQKIMGLFVEVPSKDYKAEYKGFIEMVMSETEMADFYSGNYPDDNYGLIENQYLVIKDQTGEAVDVKRWSGGRYVTLYARGMQSLEFGSKIKPKDVYQRMVVDSIMNNQVTAISGQAGSGKTLLALVVAMSLISEGKYERIVVLFNPTSVRGAAQLGYYQGSMIEKAMQTSIGNILTSKFGGVYIVDSLLKNERIKLVSMADQRGFSVNDNEILFITEAQNTSSDLIKLCLSRAENCKVIIEGDYKSQVDSVLFEGTDNGLRRAIDVLAGSDLFGYVELQNVWRSKLCELVQRI